MKNELSFKTAVCGAYERLLEKSHAKYEVWESRRKKVSQAHANTLESGDELLRLQADYAKAYNDLCTHVRTCKICQFFSKTDRCEDSRDDNLFHASRSLS
jgi:hypothetical protein